MRLLIFILFFFNSAVHSQSLNDLGTLTYNETLELNKDTPCEITPKKAITYCVEDGSFISYLFDRNQKLNGIIFGTLFETWIDALEFMKSESDNFSKKTGVKPIVTEEKIFFLMTNSISVTYDVREFNGKFYMSYSTLKL